MESDHVHVRSSNSMPKLRVILDARYSMAKCTGGHVLDEVDEAVLHAPGDQVVDDMKHERRRTCAHGDPRHRRKNARSEKPQCMPHRSTAKGSTLPMLAPPYADKHPA